jgi:hypothetical protein
MGKRLNKKRAQKLYKEGYREEPRRHWAGITPSQIARELAREGLYVTASSVRKLEAEGLFSMSRTAGNFRVTTRPGAEAIKQAIWINYTGMTREKYWEQRDAFEEELDDRPRYEERIIKDMLEKEEEDEKSEHK